MSLDNVATMLETISDYTPVPQVTAETMKATSHAVAAPAHCRAAVRA